MTRLTMCSLVAVTLVLGACATKEQAETETAAEAATGEALPHSVALAATVARGIDANPAAADSILAANGLTVAGLDSLMYTIAEDSALSAAYARAVR